MTKTQIGYLKLLGYKDTQEEGAVLEHRLFSAFDKYVWSDETFEDIISKYEKLMIEAVKTRISIYDI